MSGQGRTAVPTARACAALAILLAVLVSACGGSSRHSSSAARARASSPPPVCTPKGLAAVAGFLGLATTSISYHAGISSQAEPTCYFTAKPSHGSRVRLSVMVERTVEAYFALERTITELSQVFAPSRQVAAPLTVPHLGLDASWFPVEKFVMTTDGVNLITATVHWPGSTQRRERALATAAARAYLGPLDYKAAESDY